VRLVENSKGGREQDLDKGYRASKIHSARKKQKQMPEVTREEVDRREPLEISVPRGRQEFQPREQTSSMNLSDQKGRVPIL